MVLIDVNVLDEHGDPFAATVTIGNGQTSLQGTGPTAHFRVPAGRYFVGASAPGYKSHGFLSPNIPEDIHSCRYPTLIQLVPE